MLVFAENQFHRFLSVCFFISHGMWPCWCVWTQPWYLSCADVFCSVIWTWPGSCKVRRKESVTKLTELIKFLANYSLRWRYRTVFSSLQFIWPLAPCYPTPYATCSKALPHYQTKCLLAIQQANLHQR